jgi:hypothetical protein
VCAVAVTIYALVWYADSWSDILDAVPGAVFAAGLCSGILHATLNRRRSLRRGLLLLVLRALLRQRWLLQLTRAVRS